MRKFTTKAPKGYSGQLIATVTTERNHWSVTGEISTPTERRRGDFQAGGCIHEEILAAFPNLKPFVDLHLSDLEGVPMHAAENGWYWLAGAAGTTGEKYTGGSGSDAKSPAECTAILAEHLRVDLSEAQRLVSEVEQGTMRKTDFIAYMETQKPRWKAESESALALLQSTLADQPAAVPAA